MEQVKEVIARHLDRDLSDIGEDTALEELGFESLDYVELMFALEEAFGADLPFNANIDGGNVRTVKDVVAMVETAVAKQTRT